MEKKPDLKEAAHEWSSRYCHSPQSEMETSPAAYDTFIHVCNTYVTPLQSQLSEAEKRIEKLEALNKALLTGTEDFAHTKWNDEFTPYQLALQENERLLSALKEREWIDVEIALPRNNGKVMAFDTDSLTPEKELLYEDGKFYYEAYGQRLDYTNHISKWKLLLINDSGER